MGKRVKRLPLLAGRAPAFTLMEVTITLTIMGFILLMIFGVFRLGISSWEKGEAIKDEFQKMRIVSQIISQQMKSIFPYKVKSQKAEGDYLAFEGKAKSLKFVSTMSLKTRKPLGFVFASYEFQEGGREGGRLLLQEKRVVNKNFMEEALPEGEAVPLFEGLADVRFEYFQEEDQDKSKTEGWVEEWSAKEEKELPRALRMTLVPRKGEGKAEEASIVILASIPVYRYEDIRVSPLRRTAPPVTR